MILVRLASYTTEETSSVGKGVFDRGVMSYVLTFFYFFLFAYRKYNKSNLGEYRGVFNNYTCKEIIRSVFAQTMQDMSRLGNYFLPSVYWGTIKVFTSFETNTRNYVFIRLLFCSLMIYFFYRQLNGVYANAYLPYHSVL